MVKTAVVAGATGGIGGACARQLHASGYSLVLNARREEPLREIAAELGANIVVGDCADESITQKIADAAEHIDVIVHSVGLLHPNGIREQTFDQFDSVIRANLRSAYTLIRSCLPKLGPGSRIVLISSIAPKLSMPGTSAYAAAKAGMNALAAVLARELEPEGISVHIVSPGPVATEMLLDTVKPYPSLASEDVADVVSWLVSLPPHVQIKEIDVRAAGRGPFASTRS